MRSLNDIVNLKVSGHMYVSLVAEGLGKQIISGDASLGDRLMFLGGGTIWLCLDLAWW